MSKDDEEQSVAKFCVYCGTTIKENMVYCPNPKCGKLIIKIKPGVPTSGKQEITPVLKKKEVLSRKCPGCGSIITSSVLEQCPICDTKLEKLPEQKTVVQDNKTSGKTGYIFTDKKLVPEQRFVLQRNKWNLREGISVFANSLIAFVTIQLVVSMLFTLQLGLTDFTFILLNQITEIIFGVYPLYYIISKKHKFQKLGLMTSKRYIILALIIGAIGSVGLILIDNFWSIIIKFMVNSGINFNDVFNNQAEQYLILQNTNLIFIILLITVMCLSVISIEIAFRGVLHNALKAHFEDNFLGRVAVILIVALVYSALFLFFTLPIGIYFFIPNLMIFIFLGIVYEINKNLLTTIIANMAYTIVSVILFVYF
ncbi:MAG: CPBP family intramembrane metalloprotease [Candidatus Lokiarchaeota archaeon]|nr:CPBP family intramembrane metalloprotease [Candidatus Lokiarchaeota archaeon]